MSYTFQQRHTSDCRHSALNTRFSEPEGPCALSRPSTFKFEALQELELAFYQQKMSHQWLYKIN